MDSSHFDRFIRSLAAAGNRRGVLRLLAMLAAWFTLFSADEVQAGKGAGGRKGGKRHGRNRTRLRHARRRHHRKRTKKKAQPQEQCSPQSPDGPCAADQLCVAGACQPCSVTCSGDASECGTALQAAIDAAPAAPILVCAGRYGGNFVINAGVALIGAGDGDDPSTSTILDAQGEGGVVEIVFGAPGDVTLERLRLTGGNNAAGAGIFNRVGRTLKMTGCTVSENRSAGPGGGITNGGTLTLSDCRIENNTAATGGGGIQSSGTTKLTGATQVRGNRADVGGGGIYVFTGDLMIDAGCQVTANTAPDGAGGGIYLETIVEPAGTVTLESDQIVTDNIGGNCAGLQIDNCEG
jgi:predicted outer membrane repeat protein